MLWFSFFFCAAFGLFGAGCAISPLPNASDQLAFFSPLFVFFFFPNSSQTCRGRLPVFFFFENSFPCLLVETSFPRFILVVFYFRAFSPAICFPDYVAIFF